MTTNFKVKEYELDLNNENNEPIGAWFDEKVVVVQYDGFPIAVFEQTHTMAVTISNNGKFIVTMTPFKMRMYDIQDEELMWEKVNIPTVTFATLGIMYFSKNDTKLMVTSKVEMEMVNDDTAIYFYSETEVIIDVLNVSDGSNYIQAKVSETSLMANKFSFDLDDCMLICGTNLNTPNDPYMIDFCIVDMKEIAKQAIETDTVPEMGDGIVRPERFHESADDPNGNVIRLIARQVDDENIFVMCIRSNGAIIYTYNTTTWVGGPVGSLFKEDDEGVITNGGISADLSVIAILVHDSDGDTDLSFYDVSMMKERFRETMEEWEDDDAILDFGDRFKTCDLVGQNQIFPREMVDKEIFVSSNQMNATIYCTTRIVTVFVDETIINKTLNALCVSYSQPINYFTDIIKQKKSMALCMGLNSRLGNGTNMITLDDDLMQIIAKYGVLGHIYDKSDELR
jgi:hypothetical protein